MKSKENFQKKKVSKAAAVATPTKSRRRCAGRQLS